MTLKRLLLGFLTLVVAAVIGQSLINSWNEPQVVGQLQLYQTDLFLQATEWQGTDTGLAEEDLQQLRQALLGKDPLGAAIQQYEETRKLAEASSVRSQTQLAAASAITQARDQGTARSKLQAALQQQTELLNQINLRLGILQAVHGEPDQAAITWSKLLPPNQTYGMATALTAEALQQVWMGSKVPSVGTEALIQANLRGWFRYRALEQVYRDRTDPTSEAALQTLLATEQTQAGQTLLTLAVINVIPGLGFVVGVGLLIWLVAQRVMKGDESLLMTHSGLRWETPWTGETVWQVLIVGFFFLGQLVLPLVLGALGLDFEGLGNRGRALFSMVYYVMMAVGGLTVLFFSIRAYLPLPEGWFRVSLQGKWWAWGLGGYLTALPLMVVISLLNQQIWQGQGGSNPLLQTVLQENDWVALGIFYATAAIAAPIFEEILFRGFLLPSLTRYMPVWGAIGLSSLVFAAAHLSLSEVLPLTLLGMMLGLVYTRSRNLLAPMLLHSAWNSITMLGLFLLGTAAS